MTLRRQRAWWPAAAGGVLLVASGCTICPDPFDYAGPVPDGSAPLDDFRARAGGIAPLGGVRRPWPPVVQAVPDDADQPRSIVGAEALRPDRAADDDEAATAVTPVASEQPAPQRTAPEPTASKQAASDAESDTAPGSEPSSGTIAGSESRGPAAPELRLEQILPAAPLPRPEIAPPLRETPGWRPRG